MHIAHLIETGIGKTGEDFISYLYELDTLNRTEKWNVSDIFLLGSPYLTHSKGIVVKLKPQDNNVVDLAKNGLARSFLDNVSDTINTMKGAVVNHYKAGNPGSSFRLHFLSARLPLEVVNGVVVPYQPYQHDTFRGYSRLTARLPT